MSAARAARRAELLTIARFAAVGAAATLVYLAVSFTMLTTRAASPEVANVVALVVGIVCSYLGHYYFTYGRPGRHTFFGARYIAVTATVFGGSIVLEQLLNRGLHLSPFHTSVAIALAYPAASFLLNHFWAFLRGRRGVD